jgi:uncharacterized protein YbjT (DUF2867 family)
MRSAAGQDCLNLVALTRREVPMPAGVRMEMRVADPNRWGDEVAAVSPHAVLCALGTTWAQAGSEQAFRAVDHDLVLALARSAKTAGASNFVLVSSVGAALHSRSFYLRVKGEVEAGLAELQLPRLDILRPGLLRGARGRERRLKERLAIAASPLTDVLLRGSLGKYRSIDAAVVAAAALQCSRETAPGTFVHENAQIHAAARRLETGR